MSDDRILAHVPAMREFVTAVNDRAEDVVAVCLEFTDPQILAVLTAGLVGELQDELDTARDAAAVAEALAREAETAAVAARAELAELPGGDVMAAWRVMKARAVRAETKEVELREWVADLQSKLAEVTRERKSA